MCVCVVKINQRKYDHYSQDQKKTEKQSISCTINTNYGITV